MVSPESASVSEKGPLLDKLRSISQRYRVSRVLDPGRRCCPPRRQAHSGWSHLGLVHWPLCCPWSPNLSTSWGGGCPRVRPASSQPSKLALHAQAHLCAEQTWDPEVREADATQTWHPHTGVHSCLFPQLPRGPGEAWAAGDGWWLHLHAGPSRW